MEDDRLVAKPFHPGEVPQNDETQAQSLVTHSLMNQQSRANEQKRKNSINADSSANVGSQQVPTSLAMGTP